MTGPAWTSCNHKGRFAGLYSRFVFSSRSLFTCLLDLLDFIHVLRFRGERESPTLSWNQAHPKRVLPGFEIWPKYGAGFGKRLWDTGFDFYLRSGIRQNLGTVCQTGKENDIRDGDDRSSGREILVKKERECGIKAPVSRPFVLYSFHCAVLDTLYCTVRYCSELYCTVSFCIAFDFIELYLLYYIALFCIVF